MAPETGLDAFIAYLSTQARAAPPGFAGAAWYILRIGEDCAHIRLQDLWRPRRFLRQLAGAPPFHFGTEGFSVALVDDYHPARHYVAFVFVGFWLPHWLALSTLYAWETAGFLRYGLRWSQRDVHCGLVGLRHGGLVREHGPVVLPGLAAAELCSGKTPSVSKTLGVWRGLRLAAGIR